LHAAAQDRSAAIQLAPVTPVETKQAISAALGAKVSAKVSAKVAPWTRILQTRE